MVFFLVMIVILITIGSIWRNYLTMKTPMKTPSNLIIRLQQAKTAIEVCDKWSGRPGSIEGLDVKLFDTYKNISDLIYSLEKVEDLPYNWRDVIP